MPKKDTLKEAGYTYVCNLGHGEHLLMQTDDKTEIEVWFANKGHASYGIRWKNADLEFARSWDVWFNNQSLGFGNVRDTIIEVAEGLLLEEIKAKYGTDYEDQFSDRTDASFEESLFEYNLVRNPVTGLTLRYDRTDFTIRTEAWVIGEVRSDLRDKSDSFFDTYGTTKDTALAELDNEYLSHWIAHLE